MRKPLPLYRRLAARFPISSEPLSRRSAGPPRQPRQPRPLPPRRPRSRAPTRRRPLQLNLLVIDHGGAKESPGKAHAEPENARKTGCQVAGGASEQRQIRRFTRGKEKVILVSKGEIRWPAK